MTRLATDKEKVTIRIIKDLLRPYLLPDMEEHNDENYLGISNNQKVRRYKDEVRSTYNSYRGMFHRCLDENNPAYKDYGGRGIEICERWLPTEEDRYIGLLNFIVDMGIKPSIDLSIDRVNNDGSYVSDNCQWSTDEEQNFNRRNKVYIGDMRVPNVSDDTGVNKYTLYYRAKRHPELSSDKIINFSYRESVGAKLYYWKGEYRTLYGIGKMEKIEIETLRRRINTGMSIHDAVTRPIKNNNRPPLIFQGVAKLIPEWAKLLVGHHITYSVINVRARNDAPANKVLKPISRNKDGSFIDVSIMVIKGKNKIKIFEDYIALAEETGMLLEDIIKALEDPDSNIKYQSYVIANKEKYRDIIDFKS